MRTDNGKNKINLVSPDNASDGWFVLNALDGLESEIASIFSESRTISEIRAKAIAKAVLKRAEYIEKLAKRR